MDCELVSGSESDTQFSQTRGGGSAPAPKSFEETFWLKFPFYLSIGMTEEQYWDSDPWLAKSYREAEEIRKEKFNEEAWLQGMYVYDAILRASPILQAFAKKGTKPKPYTEEPYPISKKTQEDAQERKEKKVFDKGKAIMEAFMSKVNKKIKNEGRK